MSIQGKAIYLCMKALGKTVRVTALTQKTLARSRYNYTHSMFNKLFHSKKNIFPKRLDIDHVEVFHFIPPEKSNTVVLYLHGGGFVYPSVSAHTEFISTIAKKAHAEVYSVEYKLAPEYTYPTQIEEIEKVYGWLLKKGYKPEDIFFIGDSAGANLALAATLKLKETQKLLPKGLVLISPPTDATFSFPSFETNKDTDIILSQHNMQFFITAYQGKEKANNPFISPYFARLKGLPNIQIFVADNELLYDDTIRFVAKLKEAKVPYELHIGKHLWHAYPIASTFLPEAEEAIDHICRFIGHGGDVCI